MPGFNISGANGNSSDQKSNVAEPRRKHRWRITALGNVLQQGQLVYLQKANRPKFKYEEATMHHDQEVAYFAGKQTWDPLSWTFYDVENPDTSDAIAKWVATVTTSWLNPSAPTTVAVPSAYKANATLQMTKGDGTVSEEWQCFGVWPQEIDWSDLDYGNTEVQMITVSCKVDKCAKTAGNTGV